VEKRCEYDCYDEPDQRDRPQGKGEFVVDSWKELLLSLWLRSELLGRGAPSLLTCGGGRLPAAA
jgi:hypothetical protein